jgi:hypothetical protein
MTNSKVFGIFLILLVGVVLGLLLAPVLQGRGGSWPDRILSFAAVGTAAAYWWDWFQIKRKS